MERPAYWPAPEHLMRREGSIIGPHRDDADQVLAAAAFRRSLLRGPTPAAVDSDGLPSLNAHDIIRGVFNPVSKDPPATWGATRVHGL
ncbi:hypothetical protein GCM10009718_29930 [Isoptericola halotolerans]|uniref:Uncharacterized protein n=1 Tax=Isoptericola halotolerans TaxID=300560 RepID=A0ABX2A7U2_9MICO|nr:hypothetical protein [Isoptericola halotolerans]NOV97666.1 hypothetical protein [Isoptericola halotolerans]